MFLVLAYLLYHSRDRLSTTEVAFQQSFRNEPATHDQSPVAHQESELQDLVHLARMVLTCLFNKIAARDPTVMPAWEVLRMATIEGAQAIGLGDEIGSLEEGKQADLILVDLTALNLTPVLTDSLF